MNFQGRKFSHDKLMTTLGVLKLRQLRIFLKFISNIEYERKMDPKQLQSGEGKQYEQIDFQTVWSTWFYGNMD